MAAAAQAQLRVGVCANTGRGCGGGAPLARGLRSGPLRLLTRLLADAVIHKEAHGVAACRQWRRLQLEPRLQQGLHVRW